MNANTNDDYSKRVIRYFIYKSNNASLNANSNSQKKTGQPFDVNIELNKIFL